MSQFIDQIKERKVIPYFITYLGGCWAVIQLLDWYIERNMFSPYWTQLVFYFLLILIPAVFVVLWAVSKKDAKKFGKFHYRFIGLNLLIALLFLGFMYRQKPMERVAEKVMVVNEVGEKVERVIPTAKYTKRVVIFPFDSKEDESDDVIRIGAPLLATIDIEQNPTQFVFSGVNLRGRYSKYNRSISENVPLSVKKKIATDTYSDLFITGEYENSDDQIHLDLRCYTTIDGRELFNKEILADDVFDLTDKVSSTYLENLFTADFISDAYDTYEDLPANSLITDNPEAFESYISGIVSSQFHQDYQTGVAKLMESLEIDPNCAECAITLSDILMAVNSGAESIKMAGEAMNNVEVLSERQQLRIKSSFYMRNSEMTKAISLFEMWRQLYPNNLEPYANLIEFYPIMGEPQKAIEIGKEAVRIGHSGPFLLRIANLLANQGEFEEAESYFFRFQEEFPGKADEVTSLGSIYNKQGRFDDAIKFYERIELMKPQDYNVKRLIGESKGKLGDLDGELNLYQQALKSAKRAPDTVSVLKNFEAFYTRLGKIDKAFETLNDRYELEATYQPPIIQAVDIFQNSTLHKMYKYSKNHEPLRKRLDETKLIFNDPGMDMIIDMIYYQITDDVEQLVTHYDEASKFVLEKSGEIQSLIFDISITHAKEEYEKALKLMQQLETKTGNYPKELGTVKPQALMGVGKYEEALEAFRPFLIESPNEPEILKEVGDLHAEMGDPEKAKEYFEQALGYLQDADPGFTVKEEILESLNKLKI